MRAKAVDARLRLRAEALELAAGWTPSVEEVVVGAGAHRGLDVVERFVVACEEGDGRRREIVPLSIAQGLAVGDLPGDRSQDGARIETPLRFRRVARKSLHVDGRQQLSRAARVGVEGTPVSRQGRRVIRVEDSPERHTLRLQVARQPRIERPDAVRGALLVWRRGEEDVDIRLALCEGQEGGECGGDPGLHVEESPPEEPLSRPRALRELFAKGSPGNSFCQLERSCGEIREVEVIVRPHGVDVAEQQYPLAASAGRVRKQRRALEGIARGRDQVNPEGPPCGGGGP